jgi:flagellar protein FlaG
MAINFWTNFASLAMRKVSTTRELGEYAVGKTKAVDTPEAEAQHTPPIDMETLNEEAPMVEEVVLEDVTVEQVEQYVQNLQRDLEFSVDEQTGRSIVKVFDSTTDELIRQIPTEEMLAASRMLMAHSKGKGILFRTKI